MWNFLYGESLTVYYLKEPDLPRDEWERMGNGAITPVEWCAHCFRRSLACLSLALVLLLLLSLSESLDIMWTSPILSALPRVAGPDDDPQHVKYQDAGSQGLNCLVGALLVRNHLCVWTTCSPRNRL